MDSEKSYLFRSQLVAKNTQFETLAVYLLGPGSRLSA